jgi:hypothetical protein
LLILPLTACNKNDDDEQPDDSMYFSSDNESDTKSLSGLGWNEVAVQPLKDYLIQKNTRSFMIIVNGRIVMEEYFNGHTPNTTWQWNSAGKTLVGTTTLIARLRALFEKSINHHKGIEWTEGQF